VARSLPSILARLSLDEALDITPIYSVTGQPFPDFRSPFISHHSQLSLIFSATSP